MCYWEESICKQLLQPSKSLSFEILLKSIHFKNNVLLLCIIFDWLIFHYFFQLMSADVSLKISWKIRQSKIMQNNKTLSKTWLQKQSHYIEVPRWEIFMEQELRFGLDLRRLAVLKKKRFGPIMSNFLGRSFQVFMGKKTKKVKTFVHTKKLRKMKLKYFFFRKKIMIFKL